MAGLLHDRPIRRSTRGLAVRYARVDGRRDGRRQASEVQGLHAVSRTGYAESSIAFADFRGRQESDGVVPWQP